MPKFKVQKLLARPMHILHSLFEILLIFTACTFISSSQFNFERSYFNTTRKWIQQRNSMNVQGHYVMLCSIRNIRRAHQTHLPEQRNCIIRVRNRLIIWRLPYRFLQRVCGCQAKWTQCVSGYFISVGCRSTHILNASCAIFLLFLLTFQYHLNLFTIRCRTNVFNV